MSNKKGFSLLSFGMYIALSSLIVYSMYSIVWMNIIPAIQSLRAHKKRVDMYIIADLFVKEIRSTSCVQWKVTEPSIMIWHDGEKDICWRYLKNKIERIEGVYTKNTWHKKITSLVSTDIHAIFFNYDFKNGVVVGVWCTISCMQTPNNSIHHYVAIRL